MDVIANGWFSEINDLWPGQCTSLQIKRKIHEEKSQYQNILIVETTNHGKALILDGIIQCTERDEFAYQEMISFLPLNSHPNPRKVLIVGGGDGGVARECSKHPLVEKIVQVEIDARVIDLCKLHLPKMAIGFASPKLELIIGDGFDFIRRHQSEFDVIITDSSDPIGPATNLFCANYFSMLKLALKQDGVICSQAGTVWTELDNVVKTMNNCRQHFDNVHYAITAVPTYPSGQIGFILAGIKQIKPNYQFTSKQLDELNLKYYNSKIHESAFILPNFVVKALTK